MGLYAKQLVYIADTGSNTSYSEHDFRMNILGPVQDWLENQENNNTELNGEYDSNACYFAEVIVTSNNSIYKVFSRKMVNDTNDFSYVCCSMATIIDKSDCGTNAYKLKNYTSTTYEENSNVYFTLPDKPQGDLVNGAALVVTSDGIEEVQVTNTEFNKYMLLNSDVSGYNDKQVIVTYLIKE